MKKRFLKYYCLLCGVMVVISYGLCCMCNDVMAASGNTSIENKALATSLIRCYDSFSPTISNDRFSENYDSITKNFLDTQNEINPPVGGLNGYLPEDKYNRCINFIDAVIAKKNVNIGTTESA